MRNKKQKWMLFLCAAMIGTLILSGCSQEKGADAETATATVAFPWSPSSLDPHGSDSWEVMRSGTGETLMKLDNELNTVPWLAEEWKREGAATWIFQLEENVTFHNGKSMDAASVKASLLRSIEKDAKAKDLLKIKAIETPAKNQLKIETTEPNAALPAHLADPSVIIGDVETLGKEDTYPALTGPFQIKQYQKDESLVVKRYEPYWGEKALLSEITIQFIPEGNTRLMALQSGDVDAAVDIPIDNIAVLEKNNQFQVMTAPSLRTHMMLFNFDSPLFKNKALRAAVDALIPRDEIVESVMKGKAAAAIGPFPELLPFSQGEEGKAASSFAALMKNEGWQKNEEAFWEKNGSMLEVNMLTFPQRPELTVMAEIIQSRLLENGVKLNLRQVENIDEALVKEKWDVAMYSMLTAHTGDPQYFLNLFYRSDSGSNPSHYASPALDGLIGQLNGTDNKDKRNELARDIQKIINNDLPQSFIVHPETVFALKKGMTGFSPHPIEYYYITAQMNMTRE
ncbi:ABC transporter substrate-binding protein [Domibacillus robiginosus]|uniref:ABC transporter substrate-binding protein n=1 Tax=Domibacillus robiginosus TaxID=1071054 RepID=UPI000B1DB0D5|nr:ABC transporter substrate-binding protein [Domibacillus robiginosus]